MSDKCICCGRVIPEGRHICLLCERSNDMQTFKTSDMKFGGRGIKSNADVVRNMTNEELAKFMHEYSGVSEDIWRYWLDKDVERGK